MYLHAVSSSEQWPEILSSTLKKKGQCIFIKAYSQRYKTQAANKPINPPVTDVLAGLQGSRGAGGVYAWVLQCVQGMSHQAYQTVVAEDSPELFFPLKNKHSNTHTH